jgi:hypothetical protein
MAKGRVVWTSARTAPRGVSRSPRHSAQPVESLRVGVLGLEQVLALAPPGDVQLVAPQHGGLPNDPSWPRLSPRKARSSRRRIWNPPSRICVKPLSRWRSRCREIALPLRAALRRSASARALLYRRRRRACCRTMASGGCFGQNLAGSSTAPRPDRLRQRQGTGDGLDLLGKRAARAGGGAHRGRGHDVRGHALSRHPLCARPDQARGTAQMETRAEAGRRRSGCGLLRTLNRGGPYGEGKIFYDTLHGQTIGSSPAPARGSGAPSSATSTSARPSQWRPWWPTAR